ncbi:biotin--[acetyl-CoA-carboxylase] ligase [Porphyrobacter sp. HT-58-2]|uniref:biotin--[acetyl-CoA-carboxylase] ligase n=1 Tax=Porphyrobacter sp. HT-58-2 TaxID=2023229 RepID=UPI000CDCC505|nr:biotin--[acetyl-CoA-carboxylase] ligase [Porphyrobacter sp. HT-58-2]AUX70006.1 biotin--[acetyl-CoA-carboxylase] ligase [Porphyrobacter sp. HT-58-2]
MIHVVEETGSTNADLAAALRSAEGWAEGAWLVARRQTAGRGRQGREWFDGAGNFMGSTVVEVGAGAPPAASLSFVAAIAVFQAARIIKDSPAGLALKWPNDVLLNGGKLSGILLEMVRGHVVVGIGVNLARAPQIEGRKTAALADVVAAPDVEHFARVLAEQFASNLAFWRADNLGGTLERFLGLSIHALGSSVTVHDTDGSVLSGTFAGLEESDGALRLRLADGSERVIRAGDIS